jgi:energy-coupling factor transport system permease protein
MSNITLGQYIPLDSYFHRLDPRSKICAMVAILVAIFLPTGFTGYLILGVVLIGCVLAAKLRFSFVIKALKPSVTMMIFLLIINIFVLRTGTPLFHIGRFAVYDSALIQTAYIAIRLLLMIMTTTLLTATTKPTDMTMGIEDLLTPLEKLHVPTHDIAMMIALALRFIPTLIDEANRILKAQASRGVDVENGTFREKITAILSLIIPMFVSCFQRADDLADAMEARGYVVGAKRVRYKQLKFSRADYVVLIGANLILAGFIVWAVWSA